MLLMASMSTKIIIVYSGVQNSVATVVINPPGPLSRLITIYFHTLEADTITQLERLVHNYI